MLSPVRLSVRQVKTVEVRIMQLSLYGNPITLVFVGFLWVPPTGSLKKEGKRQYLENDRFSSDSPKPDSPKR